MRAYPDNASTRRVNSRASVCGFSLIEIIATLVIVGVAAALLSPIWVSGLRMGVEGAPRLQSAHTISSVLEEWVAHVKTFHADSFDDLPSLAEDHFSNNPEIEVVENLWVTFSETHGGVFHEAISADPSDHLRFTIQHASGIRQTYIFSRSVP